MTLQEMREQKIKLEKQIAEEEKKELAKKQQAVEDKIASYSDEEKEFMLKLIEHSRTSCDNENPWNGWDGNRFRCSKCMLMEILNGQHGGEFDFSFDVCITRVTV